MVRAVLLFVVLFSCEASRLRDGFNKLFKREPKKCDIIWTEQVHPHCETTYEEVSGKCFKARGNRSIIIDAASMMQVCEESYQDECHTTFTEECKDAYEEICKTEFFTDCKQEYHEVCDTEYLTECKTEYHQVLWNPFVSL